MRRTVLIILSVPVFLTGLAFSQAHLPKTPLREVTEEYYGTKVTDPYR